ncbi:hypothetical protein Dimus_000370, partial [Dionaea muscipula]
MVWLYYNSVLLLISPVKNHIAFALDCLGSQHIHPLDQEWIGTSWKLKLSKVDIFQLKGCKYCVKQRRYPTMRFKVSSNDLFRRTAVIVETLGNNLPDDYWDFIPKDRLLDASLNRSNRRVLSHAQ